MPLLSDALKVEALQERERLRRFNYLLKVLPGAQRMAAFNEYYSSRIPKVFELSDEEEAFSSFSAPQKNTCSPFASIKSLRFSASPEKSGSLSEAMVKSTLPSKVEETSIDDADRLSIDDADRLPEMHIDVERERELPKWIKRSAPMGIPQSPTERKPSIPRTIPKNTVPATWQPNFLMKTQPKKLRTQTTRASESDAQKHLAASPRRLKPFRS